MKTLWAFNHSTLSAQRMKLGLSPRALGQAIGVTGQTIRNWERGIGRGAKGDDISALANLFRVSPAAFWMLVPQQEHLTSKARRPHRVE